MIGLQELRALRREVEAAFEGWEAKLLGAGAADLKKVTETGPFSYRWPGGIEEYDRTAIYRDPSKGTEVRVAWGRRDAWGLKNRGRVVVFGRRSEAQDWWPWVEWTEADDGRWTAAIYTGKRRQLRVGENVPPLPIHGDVVPVTDVFNSVKGGNTARLVVAASQEHEMARYGLFVGQQRHGEQ